jgi:phage terminase large subunit-like protein
VAAAREGWNFACPDWKDRLRAGRSLVPDLPLDAKEAARATAIFNRLRLPDVPGNPSLGESGGDWVRDLVAPVFGSVDADGVRHVGEFLSLVPKKNMKTTGGAATMLTAMLAEDPKRSRNQQFHLYGPTQPIAELAFYQAVGMIRADPDGYLQKRFHIRDHVKTIVDQVTNNELRVKTFDMKVSTGTIPKGVLVDELHVLGSMHYASRVIGQIRGGLVSRADSFLGFITTQSDEPPSGAFRAELMLARGIRDGSIRGKAARMLPVLYEFPEEVQTSDEWREPKIWHQVNPNLGHSVTIDRLEADWAQAQEKGEEEVRRWASQHLNVEVGLALHSDRWRGADYWDGAADETLTLDSLIERSEVVVVGGDGGGLDDLWGLCVAGRERGTDRWLYWFKAWCWPDVLVRRKQIEPLLRDFEKDGDLVICQDRPPPSIDCDEAEYELPQDLREIVEIIAKVHASGKLPARNAVGLDAQGVSDLVDALLRVGLGEEQIVAIGQGYRLMSAIIGLARHLKFKKAVHSGSRMMAWCAGNAKEVAGRQSVMIDKVATGSAKIDPLVAGFNATKLLEAGPEAAKGDNGGLAAWARSLKPQKAMAA